tara:strand:- start:26 stop:637 length:612 start_codon:yes stop_codon:yes gene_type:complete
MLDIQKYSKKNWFFKYFFTKILGIEVEKLSKEFFYKDNVELKFKESFFYNYIENNKDTKWSGIYGADKLYQSNHDLQKLNDLKEPIDKLEKLLNDVVKKKIFKNNCVGKFKIKRLWFVIQKKNLGHIVEEHNHPKSSLSGVYYFKVDKGSGGELNLHFENKKTEFMPGINDLVVFNSETLHSVNSYYGQNDRIAVAWDAIYTF